MIFCLCAAGAYGIEDMIPMAGPGLTLVMLIVLPFLWSIPMAFVASELGSAIPQEGGFYKWVQRACGEFWGFQAFTICVIMTTNSTTTSGLTLAYHSGL